jgi:hypothetical protein
MAKKRRLSIVEVTVAVAILALAVWFFQPGGYFRPINFPDEQVREHLPTDRPERLSELVRVDGVADTDHLYRRQRFGIVIDRIGHPSLVKYLPSTEPEQVPPPAVTDSAIGQIRTWTFAPFPLEGHPVYARFVAEFTLVPEQDRPAVHIAFPPVTDVTKVVMTYDEAGPKNLPRAVTVHGDGKVEIANTSVLSQQHFQATIPQEQVLSLIDGFRRADFFSLKDSYGGGPADGIRRKLSITIDGQTKTISDDEGQFGGLPDTVMEVESALRRAGGIDP